MVYWATRRLRRARPRLVRRGWAATMRAASFLLVLRLTEAIISRLRTDWAETTESSPRTWVSIVLTLWVREIRRVLNSLLAALSWCLAARRAAPICLTVLRKRASVRAIDLASLEL